MTTDQQEPAITINGHTLTPAQAMTVRSAIESLAGSLQEDGLGADDTGKAMVAAYLARISEIREMIFNQ